jgi:hypothetical protein
LTGLTSWWELPWCIGRSRDVRLIAAMLEFFDLISIQGLLDLPLAQGSFTWSNNHDISSWSHLDRFLVSPEWEVSRSSLEKAS